MASNISIKPVLMMSYMYESTRLSSFRQKWIYKDAAKCSAKKLAEAGFYFIGHKDEPDAVRCFFCQKMLDGWEVDDEPMKEHLNHSSQCYFATLGKSEKKLTVDDFFHLHHKLLNKIADLYVVDVKEQIQTVSKNILSAVKS